MPLNRRARNVYDAEPTESDSGGEEGGDDDQEQEIVQDLERGNSVRVSPTETPLLYHHLRQAGARTGRGTTRSTGSSSSGGGSRRSGPGPASYSSMSPPPVAASGRRRRRHHRHDRHERHERHERQPPSSDLFSSASIINSRTSSNQIESQSEVSIISDDGNTMLPSTRHGSDASEDEHYLEFESKDDDYGGNRSIPSTNHPRQSGYRDGTSVVGRGLRRLANANVMSSSTYEARVNTGTEAEMDTSERSLLPLPHRMDAPTGGNIYDDRDNRYEDSSHDYDLEMGPLLHK